MREVYAVYLALFSQSFLRFCGRKNEGDHVWGLVNAEQQTRVRTVWDRLVSALCQKASRRISDRRWLRPSPCCAACCAASSPPASPQIVLLA